VKRSEVEELPWEDVNSSHVRRVGYVVGEKSTEDDERLGTLYVEFSKTDTVYAYGDVLEQDAFRLPDAESVGKALNGLIKGTYDHRQVEIEEDA
jgi:hypothetical protein